MKLIYITQGTIPNSSAYCVQMLKMSDAMASLGHNVTLLARWHRNRVKSEDDCEQLRERFALQGSCSIRYLPHVNLRGRLGGSYVIMASLFARLLAPDIVFTRDPRAARAAAHAGIKVILESHTPPGGERSRHSTRVLCREPRLVRWVFISERLRQIYQNDYPLPQERTTVEHDAVDLTRFRPMLERGAAREMLGLDPMRPLVVHAGSLYEGRGGELLVQIARSMPDVDFLLVGGQQEDIERIRYECAPVPQNIRLVGHRSLCELSTYLFAADVLVLASASNARTVDRVTVHVDYSSPMKLFEYMAAGRPIVATRFSGVAEVLRHGRDGWLVDPDSLEALREGIRTVLSKRELAKRLGTAALARSEHYTWERRAQRILHLPLEHCNQDAGTGSLTC